MKITNRITDTNTIEIEFIKNFIRIKEYDSGKRVSEIQLPFSKSQIKKIKEWAEGELDEEN